MVVSLLWDLQTTKPAHLLSLITALNNCLLDSIISEIASENFNFLASLCS